VLAGAVIVAIAAATYGFAAANRSRTAPEPRGGAAESRGGAAEPWGGTPFIRPSTGLAPATVFAPIAVYRDAVTTALADHLRVWIEADLEKSWLEGPKQFDATVSRVAALENRRGVVGVKIADELGHHDGMDSPAEIRQFLSDSARALRAAAPRKLILIDIYVPQLGCMPGDQPAGSGAAECAAQANSEFPQLTLPAVDSYLRLHAIDVLDLSTAMLPNEVYQKWGTTAFAAQQTAWREVAKLGWQNLVRLQTRRALARPGGFKGSSAAAASAAREFVEIPLASGARAVDVWTWHQEYSGKMFQLMGPGLRSNALWDELKRLRRAGDVLFTHISPSSVNSSMTADLAQIATVFTDVFIPAGTG
jgi:hypothetical protein